jgi:hypothetical protein
MEGFGMTKRNGLVYFDGRALRSAAVTMLLATCAIPAVAQVDAQLEEGETEAAAATAPPYSLFQYSTLTGSGNTLTATWLPIVTAKGTIYKNLTLAFNVDANGNLTVAPGYPKFVVTPPPLITAFRAGKYIGPGQDSGWIFNVSGPGLAAGGATEWSLAAAPGVPAFMYPLSATWYAGPIATNPLAARLKAAGITSTAFSYGTATSECGCPRWRPNTLIGVSQIGKTLTIVSFTSESDPLLTNGDHSRYIDQIVYTLQ